MYETCGYNNSTIAVTVARMASPSIAGRSARAAVHTVVGKRFLSDIAITRTGKPILRVEGGRYVKLSNWLSL